MFKFVSGIVILIVLLTALPGGLFAAPGPDVRATAFVLIEFNSGRVLLEHNAHARMYPAATTLILTSLLAYEHIGMGEIVIAGQEITRLPPASARNHHEVGEAILGVNLIRGMIIGSGLDAANVVVMEVARRATGRNDIGFSEAITFFTNLMNTRARELGALNSNFVNPHGYHHESHVSTAYDMARIARHALAIPVLAEIAATAAFSGHMAGGAEYVPPGAVGFRRTWRSANQLLHHGDFYYQDATGFRTGFTNHAGESLVAAARRGDLQLISVTFDSPVINEEPTRWTDNIALFEYGFTNFDYRLLLEEGAVMGRMYVHDPQIGDEGWLEIHAAQGALRFLSYAEHERLEKHIHFFPDYFDYFEDEYNELHMMFLTPIEEYQPLGRITFTLDGEEVFATQLLASRYVPSRTTATDIEHYVQWFRQTFFSAAAVPFWIAGFAVFLLLLVLYILARNAIKRKRAKSFKYNWKIRRF